MSLDQKIITEQLICNTINDYEWKHGKYIFSILKKEPYDIDPICSALI
jgi:hypothetical protein